MLWISDFFSTEITENSIIKKFNKLNFLIFYLFIRKLLQYQLSNTCLEYSNWISCNLEKSKMSDRNWIKMWNLNVSLAFKIRRRGKMKIVILINLRSDSLPPNQRLIKENLSFPGKLNITWLSFLVSGDA